MREQRSIKIVADPGADEGVQDASMYNSAADCVMGDVLPLDTWTALQDMFHTLVHSLETDNTSLSFMLF